MNEIKKWTEELAEIYMLAPISKTTNTEIWFDEDFRAHFKLTFTPAVCHGFGDIHGGIISTLIDNATWFTAAAQFPYKWVATSELHTYLIRPARKRDLYAEGFIISKGKKLIITKSEVRTKSGDLIAYGSATVFISNLPFSMEKAKEKLGKLK